MSDDAQKSPNSRSKCVWLRQFGPPRETVDHTELEVPPPSRGEVWVELEFAPINPADLNVLEGKYGTLPPLPTVPGVEGVGRVIREGPSLPGTGSLQGKRVLLPHGYGTWRQLGCVNSADLVVVPEAVPVEQAAMLRINPATALCMLREFVTLNPGEWLVQNAANSGVGRAVIQIARACGWKTVNVVRRTGLEEELRAIGGDAVVVEGENLAARISDATQGAALRLGLNAVGGESALGLAKALAEGGTLCTYGAMSLQPLRIPNGLLIFKDLSFRGFWVSKWYAKASSAQRASLFEQLFKWAADGILHTPIEAVYALDDPVNAVAHAMLHKRSGKVLFKG